MPTRTSLWLSAAIAGLLIAVSAAPVRAQGGTTSSISGIAVDSSGGVIPGATVEIKHNATGFTAGTTRDINLEACTTGYGTGMCSNVTRTIRIENAPLPTIACTNSPTCTIQQGLTVNLIGDSSPSLLRYHEYRWRDASNNLVVTQVDSNATGFSGQPNVYSAGVGLLWRLDGPTLFNMSVQGGNAAIARLAHQRQRLASRDQLHSDWQRLTAAIEKVQAARAQVESAQRAAQVAKDRYDVGATTQLELIQTERDLFSAEVNQIQARTELASSHVALRISAGVPLQVE